MGAQRARSQDQGERVPTSRRHGEKRARRSARSVRAVARRRAASAVRREPKAAPTWASGEGNEGGHRGPHPRREGLPRLAVAPSQIDLAQAIELGPVEHARQRALGRDPRGRAAPELGGEQEDERHGEQTAEQARRRQAHAADRREDGRRAWQPVVRQRLLATQHLAEEPLQLRVRRRRRRRQHARGRDVRDHPSDAREVDLGPGVGALAGHEQGRAPLPRRLLDGVARRDARRQPGLAHQEHGGVGEVHAVAGEVAEEEVGRRVAGARVLAAQAVGAVLAEPARDGEGLGEGVVPEVVRQRGREDLRLELPVPRIARGRGVGRPLGGGPLRAAGARAEERDVVARERRRGHVVGALEAPRVGVRRGRKAIGRLEAEGQGVVGEQGHRRVHLRADDARLRRVRYVHGRRREAGGDILIDVVARGGDQAPAVVLAEGALAEVVDARRRRIVVVEQHDRDGHPVGARLVVVLELELVVVLVPARPAPAAVPLGLALAAQAEAPGGRWRRGRAEHARRPVDAEEQKRDDGEVQERPERAALAQEQEHDDGARHDAEREEREGRVATAREDRVCDREGPVDGAVPVSDHELGEGEGDGADLEHREGAATRREGAEQSGHEECAQPEGDDVARVDRTGRSEGGREEIRAHGEAGEETHHEEGGGGADDEDRRAHGRACDEAAGDRSGGASDGGGDERGAVGEGPGEDGRGQGVDEGAQDGRDPRLGRDARASVSGRSERGAPVRCVPFH